MMDALFKFNDIMMKISEMSGVMEPIINSNREMAYEAVEEIMLDAMSEIMKTIQAQALGAGEDIRFDKAICGLKPRFLKIAYDRYVNNELCEWYMSADRYDKIWMLIEFLDVDGARKAEFMSRYPNAYGKWNEDEESKLLQMYKESLATESGKPSWPALSKALGRNPNALKIRLERLGIDLGEDAGHSRYTSSK